MRRLPQQEVATKGPGRPRVYKDPVRVSVVLEREDWENLAEMCREVGVPVAGRLREMIREATIREQPSVTQGAV